MIRFENEADGHMIATKAGCVFNPVSDVVIMRVEGDKPYGGVIYQGYTGASVHMHMAGFHPRWVNRDMLWLCFDYPFVQMGVKKIFGQVGVHNTRALELDLKLGFKEEARVKDVYPEGDMVLLAMYKEDCKWLGLQPVTLKGNSNGRQE